MKVCNKCGKHYSEPSAISRYEDIEICSDCGINEALGCAGISDNDKKIVINEINKIKYKKGTRVKLISMDDMQAPDVGTEGTVSFVDDIGSIHVHWDNGSSLAVIPGEDEIEIIK